MGLEWLKPGVNSFGSAPDNRIQLHAGAPAHIGLLTVSNCVVADAFYDALMAWGGGTATVVNGTRTLRLRPRACTVIPRQAWHRIENRGRSLVVIIEVQHGAYLGEDDIVRKQDDYGRTE